jgi:hypothetical protein
MYLLSTVTKVSPEALVANLRRGNRELMKCINRNLVLNVVKSQGPISRTKTARLSGLSLATASSSPLSSSKEKLPKTEQPASGGTSFFRKEA